MNSRMRIIFMQIFRGKKKLQQLIETISFTICNWMRWEEEKKTLKFQSKWYLNKNMWCGAIWFRDIFNIKIRREKKKKNQAKWTNTNKNHQMAAIVQYVFDRDGMKESEIEIKFLHSHFVNWREANKRATNTEKRDTQTITYRQNKNGWPHGGLLPNVHVLDWLHGTATYSRLAHSKTSNDISVCEYESIRSFFFFSSSSNIVWLSLSGRDFVCALARSSYVQCKKSRLNIVLVCALRIFSALFGLISIAHYSVLMLWPPLCGCFAMCHFDSTDSACCNRENYYISI